MFIVRSKLKNIDNVGQLGKTRKEAKLVFVDQPYLSLLHFIVVLIINFLM
jgi:hypothetical protein